MCVMAIMAYVVNKTTLGLMSRVYNGLLCQSAAGTHKRQLSASAKGPLSLSTGLPWWGTPGWDAQHRALPCRMALLTHAAGVSKLAGCQKAVPPIEPPADFGWGLGLPPTWSG